MTSYIKDVDKLVMMDDLLFGYFAKFAIRTRHGNDTLPLISCGDAVYIINIEGKVKAMNGRYVPLSKHQRLSIIQEHDPDHSVLMEHLKSYFKEELAAQHSLNDKDFIKSVILLHDEVPVVTGDGHAKVYLNTNVPNVVEVIKALKTFRSYPNKVVISDYIGYIANVDNEGGVVINSLDNKINITYTTDDKLFALTRNDTLSGLIEIITFLQTVMLASPVTESDSVVKNRKEIELRKNINEYKRALLAYYKAVQWHLVGCDIFFDALLLDEDSMGVIGVYKDIEYRIILTPEVNPQTGRVFIMFDCPEYVNNNQVCGNGVGMTTDLAVLWSNLNHTITKLFKNGADQ